MGEHAILPLSMRFAVKHPFRTGIEVLVDERRSLITRQRIALLTHPAALTSTVTWSGELLWQDPDLDLVCLLGPEHGVFGQAGAGEHVASVIHPRWGIPVHSLYGDQRRPTPEMLEAVDVIVVDLQDLGIRCYTFASTLALVMAAAAELDKTVVVTDRPVPLPDVLDGPSLDPRFSSFVAQVPTPMAYGMTQGELALLLHPTIPGRCSLQVVKMDGYASTPYRHNHWAPWFPPSTGIRSWESAWCYPATVFCEGLPALDCGRTGPIPFQVLGAPWMNGTALAETFTHDPLPGVHLHPHPYYVGSTLVDGVRLVVTDPIRFRPVTLGLTILERLQRIHGAEHLWDHPSARPGFFDQLYGTDQVRLGLRSQRAIADQAEDWLIDRAPFLARRIHCLLYP